MTVHPFIIISPHEVDEGHAIGRDPRLITEAEWLEHMPDVLIGMKAIRAKCLDCNHNYSEVNKCTAIDCALWPLRMGMQPKGLRAARKGDVADDVEVAS